MRTARGAGRVDLVDLAFDVDFLLRVWLPDDRVFEEAERALLFDDAGGEDVRVAMLPNVHKCHTSPRLPTPGPRRVPQERSPRDETWVTRGRDLCPFLRGANRS